MFEHVRADLGGIPANRLTDLQGLAGLLLAAANAAGLNPSNPPVVQLGPHGVSAALVCHGGHVALHGLPEVGLCFADVGGVSGALPQRGLDVIIKRLGAREVRTDARRRGPVTQAIHPEGSWTHSPPTRLSLCASRWVSCFSSTAGTSSMTLGCRASRECCTTSDSRSPRSSPSSSLRWRRSERSAW